MSSHLQIIAHRGASKYAPENSKSAFELAVTLGAKVIECDIAFSQDGVPFVFHDDELDRTSNGKGLISNQRWEDLSKLDIGAWFSSTYEGESILSLRELIQWFDSQTNLSLNLEIKAINPELIPEYVSKIIECVGNRPEIIFSSFQFEILDYLNQVSEAHPRAYLCTRWTTKKLMLAKNTGCFQVNIANYGITPTIVEFTHLQGLTIGVYTVNSYERFEELRRFGVDAIFTDDLKLWKGL